MKLQSTEPWRKNFYEELIFVLCTDFAAQNRGRAFPASDLDSKLKSGLGWVPINQTITAFDGIPECSLWSSHGDLRLIPDPETEVYVDLNLGSPPVHLFLGDLMELDGKPWKLCTRSVLKSVLREFEEHTGHALLAAFEHEFSFFGNVDLQRPGFSLRRFREKEPFGTYFVTALKQAGQEPETYLPEFGSSQYEVTCAPSSALRAADRSVIVRELAFDIADRLGEKLTFSPKVSPDGVGNGIHIHLSLLDANGEPGTYDRKRNGNLSRIAGQFAAGVVEFLPAILAFTAPSVLSYKRLVPHTWSAAYACLGDKNREAALRICPIEQISGKDAANQFNLEFRASDATANPYLSLSAIVLAGLEGIKQDLKQPPLVNTDPHELDQRERNELGIRRLPESLPVALDKMTKSDVVTNWFAPELLESYLALRRLEIETFAGMDDSLLCNKFAAVF